MQPMLHLTCVSSSVRGCRHMMTGLDCGRVDLALARLQSRDRPTVFVAVPAPCFPLRVRGPGAYWYRDILSPCPLCERDNNLDAPPHHNVGHDDRLESATSI